MLAVPFQVFWSHGASGSPCSGETKLFRGRSKLPGQIIYLQAPNSKRHSGSSLESVPPSSKGNRRSSGLRVWSGWVSYIAWFNAKYIFIKYALSVLSMFGENMHYQRYHEIISLDSSKLQFFLQLWSGTSGPLGIFLEAADNISVRNLYRVPREWQLRRLTKKHKEIVLRSNTT